MVSKVSRTTECSSFLQSNEQIETSEESSIFDLFRRLAENPIMEIGGRQIWSDNRGELPDDHKVHLVQVTHCFTTVKALLATLFGPKTSNKVTNMVRSRNFKKYSENPSYLKEIGSDIHNNGDMLKNRPSCFYAYVFGLFPGPKLVTIPVSSHVFLIIQYADNKGELHYRLLQSFLQRFDLKTDIANDSNFLSQTHFQSFLRNFEQFLLLKSWTTELEEIYLKFFHTKTSLKIGEPNPYFDIAPFIYGQPFTFDDVVKYDQEFAKLKQTTIFQSLMSNVIL
jgi:hypothetical protein